MPTNKNKKHDAAAQKQLLQNARSGHLAWLTRLLKEVEQAMLDKSNVDLVLQLQEKVSTALGKFRESSQKYVSCLSDPIEIQREIDIVTKQGKGKDELDAHINSWISRAQQRQANDTPYRIPPPSRADSRTSNSHFTEPERMRKLLELELSQLIRRQEIDRREEDAERMEKQKEREAQRRRELDRQHEILNVQDRLERACLDESYGTGATNSPSRTDEGPHTDTREQLADANQQGEPNDLNNAVPQIPIARNQAQCESIESHSGAHTGPVQANQPDGGEVIAPHGANMQHDATSVQSPFNRPDSSLSRAPICGISRDMQQPSSPTMPIYNATTSVVHNGGPPPYRGNFQHYGAPNVYYSIPQIHNRQQLYAPSHFATNETAFPRGYEHPQQMALYGPRYAINNNRFNTIVDSLGDMADAFRLGADLPKPELLTFSGDPRHFFQFQRAFSTIIEPKTNSDSLRLHYLIQYCTGPAREAIEYCSMFADPSLGLREAKATLANNFGQPYDVVQAYKNPIMRGPNIRPNDSTGLLKLATEMRKCELALAQLGFSSDINNSDTLLKIVWKLPFYLQNKWVSRANEIFRSGRDPCFGDLTEFISGCARMANNFYGRNLRRERPETPQARSNNQPTRVMHHRSTLVTSLTDSDKLPIHPTCLYCNDASHSLAACPMFQGISVDERYKYAATNKICHNCLLVGHLSMGCLERSKCTHANCRRKHDTLLHPLSTRSAGVHLLSGDGEEPAALIDDESEQQQHADEDDEEDLQFNINLVNEGRACLHVVPVSIRANGKCINTHALLDTGSDVSLCTRSLIEELGVKGKPALYSINTINSTSCVKNGIEVAIDVSSLDDSEEIHLPKVWGVDAIPVNTRGLPTMKDISHWKHLSDISFPKLNDTSVDLLIGGDTPEAFWVLDQRIGQRKEPYAVKTLLGWSLMGPLSRGNRNSGTVNKLSHEDLMHEQVQRLWNTDFNDINDLDRVEMSKNDKVALSLVENSVNKTENNKYSLGFPWCEDKSKLCGNYAMAKSRLRSLHRRLSSDPLLRQKYSETMEKYLADGHARILSYNEIKPKFENLWFLPHHPVVHPMKPGKLRVVFDCAAVHGGKSLNKFLHKGPDMTSNLLGVILRFRKERIALIGDIEAMFHQIKMKQTDRDKLCFLWWPKGDINADPITCQMTVHLFGAASSPFCANFCLRKTATDNWQRFDKSVLNTVARSFYVDDCLASVATVDEAVALRKNLSDLLALGGFRITKWSSNSKEVIQSIPNEELAPSISNINLEFFDLPTDRALGVTWDINKDTIGFKHQPKEKPFTKRGVLSTVSSVYDPMGIISPFLLRGKVILQELSRLRLGWDDSIPTKVFTKWKSWVDELPLLVSVAIPRCIKPERFGTVTETQLHHFSDASQIGYGTASYLRLKDNNGNICCGLIYGKSRLAPVKTVSVPRLELTAATLAVKVNNFLLKELDMPINSTFFWTDSKTVLKYLHNKDRRFHTFVANRISTIDSGSSLEQWGYVNTDNNPADDATRGLKPSHFTSSCRWLTGPDFLKKSFDSWPRDKINTNISEDDHELKRDVNVVIAKSTDPLVKLIERHSSWSGLLKSIAWLRRYIIYLKSKREQVTYLPHALSAEEISGAENSLIAFVQKLEFSSFIDRNGCILAKKLPKSMRKLRPFMHAGIIRVGGRLSNAPIQFSSRHPVIIPKGHVAQLIIRHHHQTNGHIGPSHTWTIIRQSFWLISGGASVRKITGNCLHCMKRNSRPCIQLMADLPAPRVTPDMPPFKSTGVDFFGPLLVKVGRSTPKRWCCLFTCLASRAIHLELANDLSITSFINAFRRFASRRGTPSELHSDNGTNFVGAEKELCNLYDQFARSDIQAYMSTRKIKWMFNPPCAPHMGGSWERMVGLVKRCLKSVLQEQTVNEETLHTTLLEVENIVNSRPLIPVTMDPAGEMPLTPNHLLLLQATDSCFENVRYEKTDNYARRRWRQVQYLAQQFWQRWKTEYLPILQERRKWQNPTDNLKIGDLVLMSDDGVPRGRWPIARVVETFPGRDGNIRQVKLKAKLRTYIRPITRLYKLQIK